MRTIWRRPLRHAPIFDTVCTFYVTVVNKMIKIFPFHDDVLRDLVALNPDPTLQNYQLTTEDEMPLYSADNRVDTFWLECAFHI